MIINHAAPIYYSRLSSSSQALAREGRTILDMPQSPVSVSTYSVKDNEIKISSKAVALMSLEFETLPS